MLGAGAWRGQLVKQSAHSSFSCWAVSSDWVSTMAATSLFGAFLLMAFMFRSSRKTSCLCGMATLRRHNTFPLQYPVCDVPTAVGWISNTLNNVECSDDLQGF